MGYAFEHEGRGYTPEGVMVEPADIASNNAKVEAAELAHWAAKPDTFSGYVKVMPEAIAQHAGRVSLTTWTGVHLGYGRMTRRYRNNLGAWVECYTFAGTNGGTYYGRKGAEWDLIRVRRSKKA